MLRFTKEEFETMVDELLYREPVSFDMLCHIAEKTLSHKVEKWCRDEDCLRGRGYEKDIMQEIYLRLMLTTVDMFLLRDGVNKPYNDDPEGFEDWLFTVARNLKCDFANKVRNIDFKTKDIDEVSVTVTPTEGYDETQEKIDRFKKAFAVVLAADTSVYKVLTWVAQFIFILDNNITKIKSNDAIIAAFEDKTLCEMYEMILAASKRIPWLEISYRQNEKICAALRQPAENGGNVGQQKYKDFFMKQNGVASGKKSVSDWTNRINTMIRKELGNDF